MKKIKISILTATVLGSIVFTPAVNAADVTVSSTLPLIHFDDTDSVGEDWRMSGNENFFYLRDQANDLRVLVIPKGANSTDSFAVDSSGDIGLADDSVFIDKSENRMGIGTVAPESALHIAGSSTDIILDEGTDAKWTINNNGGWLNINGDNGYTVVIAREAATESLVVNQYGNVAIGLDWFVLDPYLTTAKLTVGGSIENNDTITSTWSGSNTVNDGLTTLATLSADNSASGKVSDAGFRLENAKVGFIWDFRTLETAEGFAATKLGTGGPEFRVDNPTSDHHNAKVSMGGVVVFENGQLQTPSSRALKTNIKPLDTQAALEAFHDLQPVSYAYKAHKDEAVVGFIAEDIPELVATKTRTGIDATEILAVLTKVVQEQELILAETRTELMNAQEKIAKQDTKITKLEAMQKRVAQLESILTNLALDTSKTQKEKVSLNLK